MRLFRPTLATAALLALPLPALAHPHIFLDARLEVAAGDDGNLAELRNVWRFDEVFSSSVLLDFDKNSDLKLDATELAELGETMRASMADFNYFTTISVDGKDVPVAKPGIIHVSWQQGQILVIFAVKPSKPVPLKGKLAFGVYDPSMYTAVNFPTDNDLKVEGKGFAACQHAVVRPDPDEVIAQNKDTLTDAFFSDPTGTDMTKLFATRMEVSC